MANERFVKHLEEEEQICDKHTPALFTHATGPIELPLVVDSFGVK
jgi:hypothetical protein